MTKDKEQFEVLREIVESIDPMQTNADWGRDFGLAVFETEDEDLIIYFLAEAGESYRSRQFSALKKKSRDAAHDLKSATNGHRADAIHAQLEMPIIAPGFPQIPLGNTYHLFLVDSCVAMLRHIKGAVQNYRVARRARDITEQWPTEPIHALISSGRIRPEDLIVDPADHADDEIENLA